MTPDILSQTVHLKDKTFCNPAEPGLAETFPMAGKTLFWLQSVATVLPFAPPGLLLIATFLQLRQSPVHRMLSVLKDEIRTLAKPAGSSSQMKQTSKDPFESNFRTALERARRDGRNLKPMLDQLCGYLECLDLEHQTIREIFTGILVRTQLAVLFAAGLTLIAQSTGLTTTPDIRQTTISAIGSGCLLITMIILPLRALSLAYRSLDIPGNGTGYLVINWIKTGRWRQDANAATSATFDETRESTEESIKLPEILAATIESLRRTSRKNMKYAENLISVYEILALAPATAILVTGNLF
jgi:hypothetical protein